MASQEGSANEYYLIGILLLLLIALTLSVLGKWKPLARRLGIVPEIHAVSNPNLKVWVNKRSGFYYCPDSKFYGKMKPGVFMTETEALQTGHSPALNETCR